MKKYNYTPEQVVYALKQHESGETVASLCRKMGVSEATFYNWKKRYVGMGVGDVRELHHVKIPSRVDQLQLNFSFRLKSAQM